MTPAIACPRSLVQGANATDVEIASASERRGGSQQFPAFPRNSDVPNSIDDGASGFARLAEPTRQGTRATAIGIAVSVSLAFVKILAGVVGNAYALIADGVESVLDVFSAALVWGSLRIAASPPNERYPYGYGRAESLAGLVAAITLLATALGIAIQSVREILAPRHAPRRSRLSCSWW